MNTPDQLTSDTYALLLRELTDTAKQVIRNESELIQLEMRETLTKAFKHFAELFLCMVFFLMSAGALLTALIIFLAHFATDRIDLSALLVAVAFCLVGMGLMWHSLHGLETDFGLPKSRKTLKVIFTSFMDGGHRSYGTDEYKSTTGDERPRTLRGGARPAHSEG